ncbi:hypothetical protein [Halapricum desulfuricans]|uniref:Putative membrane protein n=1 Tax=Halapricum desulfuricans TaxID=2841257 RepID=A0A897NIY7_9EURY|nr:hypothetical protein [Halapricum desulfuricans]QSG08165.1 putative membrane protein [Halapricum desulfuricans]QSG12707.1 putative membrane protein [Halapricum desulfuricans]
MHDRIERVTGATTAIALVAAAVLLAPAFAGFGASLALAVVAVGLTVLAFLAREAIRTLAPVPWLQLHFETVWVGAAVAALVLVAFAGVTPAELQTLGAVVGLLGLFNYLLRPIYLTLGSVLTRVTK